MPESVSYIFKRPAPRKDQPFRKSEKSIAGVYVAQKHYSANIPQEINLAAFPRYCLCVTTSRLGKYRTTSSSEVEHRGRELEQWDKPLCASVPALHGSKGTEKRDERD